MKRRTIVAIEEGMADVILAPEYPKVVVNYEAMLAVMGNVDGNEVISLVLLAMQEVAEES